MTKRNYIHVVCGTKKAYNWMVEGVDMLNKVLKMEGQIGVVLEPVQVRTVENPKNILVASPGYEICGNHLMIIGSANKKALAFFIKQVEKLNGTKGLRITTNPGFWISSGRISHK